MIKFRLKSALVQNVHARVYFIVIGNTVIAIREIIVTQPKC